MSDTGRGREGARKLQGSWQEGLELVQVRSQRTITTAFMSVCALVVSLLEVLGLHNPRGICLLPWAVWLYTGACKMPQVSCSLTLVICSRGKSLALRPDRCA